MGKLTYKEKLIFIKNDVGAITLSKKHSVTRIIIYYLEDLINRHGYKYFNYDRIKTKLKGLSPVNYRYNPLIRNYL